MTRVRKALLAALLVAVTGTALLLGPGERVAASAIVDAPNRGMPEPAPIPGEIRIPTRGATIAVELVEPSSADGPPLATVFVLHGIRDRRESMRGLGHMLAAHRLRAVLVDLRGHGRSTGDHLTYGVFDRDDLATVASTLAAEGRVAEPFAAFGFSYGAATAIQWSASDPRLRAVVAVAPFASLRAIVPEYTPLPLPARYVDSCVDRAGREAGFDPDRASPEHAVTTTATPLLLVHGDADERIPIAHSRRIAAAAGGHAELVVVHGATHESVFAAPEIADRAIPWLEESVTRAR